jgi:hypothetical protein
VRAIEMRGTALEREPLMSVDLEFGSAEFKWATTDEGKEALRRLRENAPDFKELDLSGSACRFRSLLPRGRLYVPA